MPISQRPSLSLQTSSGGMCTNEELEGKDVGGLSPFALVREMLSTNTDPENTDFPARKMAHIFNMEKKKK